MRVLSAARFALSERQTVFSVPGETLPEASMQADHRTRIRLSIPLIIHLSIPLIRYLDPPRSPGHRATIVRKYYRLCSDDSPEDLMLAPASGVSNCGG